MKGFTGRELRRGSQGRRGRLGSLFLAQRAVLLRIRSQPLAQLEEGGAAAVGADETVDATPEEALEGAYATLREDLESELLDQVKAASPEFFERLVVEQHGARHRRVVASAAAQGNERQHDQEQ